MDLCLGHGESKFGRVQLLRFVFNHSNYGSVDDSFEMEILKEEKLVNKLG